LAQQRQLLPRLAQPPRRLRLAELREQLAELAQLPDRVPPHAERDALRRAEQIAEHRHRMVLYALEQQRGPALAQNPVAQLGHLQARIDLRADTTEIAARFELAEEVAQVAIRHRAPQPGCSQGAGMRSMNSATIP